MAAKENKRTPWAFLPLIAAVLALATIVIGLIAPGFAYSTFDTPLIIMLAAGILGSILCFLVRLDFLPLLTAAVYGCAFGRVLYRAAPVIADKANNISFQGGNFETVVLYIALTGLACILMIVACFHRERA